MVQLTRPKLNAATEQALLLYQQAVDANGTFPAKVIFAKDDFPRKNVIGNIAFDHVKIQLIAMCNGAERCHYCEDSAVDEVEHFYPKDAYPNKCYEWGNFFYVCGPCNNKKNNHCAVIDADDNLIDVTPAKRKRGQPPVVPVQPTAGTFAFINTEKENPLDFFMLDLFTGTFEIVENPTKTGIDKLRASETLKVFGIGKKRVLIKARKRAYSNLLNALDAYHAESQTANPDPLKLQRIVDSIKTENHQTVWQEMKRQRHIIAELTNIFDRLPAVALTW